MRTPSLVGKRLDEAVAILSDNNLNLRLLAQKEDADLAPGTIISQTPSAQQKIKPRQSVYLVLSKKPLELLAPHLLAKSTDERKALLATMPIRIKEFQVPSTYPKGFCVAQDPGPQQSIENNQIMLYTSDGGNKPIIWPDFTDKLVSEVQEFLQSHGINPEIMHHLPPNEAHTCATCQVIEQRPLAGSLLMLNPENPLRVQLRVQ